MYISPFWIGFGTGILFVVVVISALAYYIGSRGKK